ncbi:tRNA (5-methylaminomethyl-2-thiouridine)(34)-methyltransferase MnmD [Rhodohalobacter halophilus]|uniref:tRNA (5-methylaminomethyl-2-thiouridine)(34)-methyltransferase MnmD n=1 Tax=Rhodohalobacter halophilus TaxID=1812810 RepID=UPI00083F73CF|nr:tRNA (5-methylaminomethyl-2-thiouridine)(34)-methyltransferase MnmD [Rhodohalobacter halophilus]
MESVPDQPIVSKTKDGSTTLYSARFDQHYHNPNGAVSESRIVFFETSGLLDDLPQKEQLNIFEMGFGTGLNLILLKDYLEKSVHPPRVTFYSVEAFPVDVLTAQGFDFGDELNQTGYRELLPQIFEKVKPGLNTFHLNDYLTLQLFIGRFEEMPDPDQPTHYIFHDPFSPEVNEELWTPDVFTRLHSFSAKSAKLATYCAASKARAAMAVGGWKVAKAPGALGKREMTLAAVDEKALGSLKRVNEQRLTERYRKGDFD